MEAVKNDILRFLKTYGSGDGYGYGYGSGYGSGSGDGYGSGDGSGDGSGYGDGDGYGDGSGYGSGSGDGDGDGSGDGSKQKYSKKINYPINGKIDNFKVNLRIWLGIDVYYVDGLPCTFISVKGNLAKVLLIDVDNLTSKEMFIGKFDNCFAHADTGKLAIEEAVNKYFSLLDVDAKVLEFKKEFSDYSKLYSNELFYKWHTILTGSCSGGKEMFIKNKSISLSESMTVNQFINLTSNEYNGGIIKKLS